MAEKLNTTEKLKIRDDSEQLSRHLKQNRVVPLDMLTAHPNNYRMHPDQQINNLKSSLERFGQGRSIVVQDGPEGYVIVAGHGIVEAARKKGWRELRADILPADWSQEQVRGYLIADNMHNEQAEDDSDVLLNLLKEQQEAGFDLASLGTDEEVLRQMLSYAEDTEAGLNDEVERPEKGKQPSKRTLAFDMIFTWNTPESLCCIAVQAGFKYGIQSRLGGNPNRVCPIAKTDMWKNRHKVTFVDNDYFKYDHARHLEVVSMHRPKYATVMDAMTRAQCAEAGIEYRPLEQILDWAEELRGHAENVIVIPKYDCIDKIPAHFMLGYSVPTSHGGTPLPVHAFKGRRVHLLGGSWKNQLSYMAELGDDCISADNNAIALIAHRFGQFTLQDGETRSLVESGFPGPMFSNPRSIAFAISCGAMAMKINELYPHPMMEQETLAEEEEDYGTR